ncbi:uncharacterized protein MAM_00994 [Metarhizium album ARSEF 1941]|uniref:Uncharacterized protein n=1 Tax=Metarhizium album (strain ARSEF 1941) TaxID=1081103 RepID=A0A0B2X892_METAS|nr:uncharacterized protein MAM_00994 [Metarhizium album ARSEF 1941]KHO01993.1 hypothetical protein MAM_00994 [Metarhizium album ARSEF 1941]
MYSGPMPQPASAGGTPASPGRPQSHPNGHPARSEVPECRIRNDQQCNDGSRCKSNDWRITDSTLFAYNAMSGCSHAETTNLYAWLKGHHRNCGPENDCSLLLQKLEAQDPDSAQTDGDRHDDGRVFSVPRPSYEATTQWGDETRLHRARGSTLRAGSEGNFATQHSRADCRCSGECNVGVSRDLQDPYVSDGEDPGRISPDTFRLWTKNCAKVQKHSHNQPAKDLSAKDVERGLPRPAKNRVDETPDDSATASISPVPSGEHQRLVQQPKPTGKADKHDEIRTWQRKLSLHAATPATATGTSHRLPNQVHVLTLPQVQSALGHPLAPPTIHTVPLSQYTSALGRRASFLDSSESHLAQLARVRSHLHGQVLTLQETLDSITAHAGKIMRRRHPLLTEADAKEQSERDDIYAYLGDYMRSLDAECDARHEKLHLLAREVHKLREQEARLRDMIGAVGTTVGVGTEEVNGDVGEMERLVRLIDEGETGVLGRQRRPEPY